MNKTIEASVAWVQVRYQMEPQGVFTGDTFNIRVIDDTKVLPALDKIVMIEQAIEKFLERFPNFEIQKPEYISSFLKETKGDAVIWFSRKK